MYIPGIGVFGGGDNTVRLLIPILRHFGFNIEAIWCRTASEADNYALSLNIPFKTTKEDEVLLHKKVELIFIVCPPYQQAEIAVKALNIGKHVICGLPVANSLAETEKMVKAARYYPSLMCLLSNGLRHLPCFVKMKQLIAEGYIGNVLTCEARVYCKRSTIEQYNWTCEDKMGGGILSMEGSFIIDLVSYLIGQKATRVHGVLRTYSMQSEKIVGIRHITSDDFCSFQMDMTDGACVVVVLSYHVPKTYAHEICISGTKGCLIARGCELFEQKFDSHEVVLCSEKSDLAEGKLKLPGDIQAQVPEPRIRGLWRMVESLRDAFDLIEDRCGWVTRSVNTATTFHDGEYIEAVIDAVKQSSSTHEWVPIPKPKTSSVK